MNATSNARLGSGLDVAVGLAGVLMFAACASAPPVPTASLQGAQQAISTAERAEAGRYAPEELSEARTKLASADTAVVQKRMTIAERFAEESRTEAELAAAKTANIKAKAVNDEMTRSNDTLIDEMQRNSGVQP